MYPGLTTQTLNVYRCYHDWYLMQFPIKTIKSHETASCFADTRKRINIRCMTVAPWLKQLIDKRVGQREAGIAIDERDDAVAMQNAGHPGEERGNFERTPPLLGNLINLVASLTRFMGKLNKIHRLCMIIIKILLIPRGSREMKLP